MTAFRRVGLAATATALVFAAGLCPTAAGAVGGATAEASTADSSTCTTANVSQASDQADPPWEIAAADPSQLFSPGGEQLTGSGVTVAVIDTGIQQQTQLQVSGGGEVLNGETTSDKTDDDGHGTMVSSIIAAQKVNGLGMQGIAPGVSLMSLREAGCNATSGNDEKTMATAIDYAVRNGAQVINISQDGYDTDPNLAAAVQYAYDNGVVIVASAGNQGDRDTTDSNGTDYGVNPRTYPASYQPYVLAVGAVDQFGNVAPFSETGSAKNSYFVGVSAPGVQVGGLLPNGKIAIDDGTSFAAPYVAAEAALLIQEHGWAGSDDASPARAYEVMKIIEATASGNGAYSPAEGWGEVDIQKAVQTLLASPELVPVGAAIPGLTKLQGDGPLADGPAVTTAAVSRAVVKPYVATAANQQAQNQQRWAYIALVVGLLVAVVALAAAAVARDAARRRGASRL
jgi:subtilisin family serine protease